MVLLDSHHAEFSIRLSSCGTLCKQVMIILVTWNLVRVDTITMEICNSMYPDGYVWQQCYPCQYPADLSLFLQMDQKSYFIICNPDWNIVPGVESYHM